MGIQGLLQFTKNVSRESHLKELSGTTVAIDAYCWLHKGCYSCAEKLVKGEKTNGYVNYCMKMVNMLVEHNIKPILVFDGMHLPSKKETEIKRRENRQKYKKLAKQHLREGNLKAARDCFNRCVDVTSAMALEVIKACRKLGIDCIVAPYEADAQLAYLNKQGFAQTIITEDSDLIIFGCEKIFYKMDATGRGVLIEKNNLHQCSNIKPNTYTFEKFRRMCILSGCDYLPSLPGIGLAKACKFFMMTSITDIETLLRKLPTYLKMPNVVVDDAYIDGFIQAENTFQYQLAFCPRQRKLVPNDPYPDGIAKDTFGYAGSYFKDSDAFQIALGNIDVNTMKILDNFNPDSSKQNVKSNNWKQKKSSSIWHKDYVAKAVDDHEKDELHHGKTKDKVVTLSLDMLKKTRNKSPTKCHKSPRKCKTKNSATGGLDENELTALYSPSVKRRKNDFELSDVEISKSPSPIKRINPFRVVKKSPQKKILSRFFCSPVPNEDESKCKNEEVVNELNVSANSLDTKIEKEDKVSPDKKNNLRCKLQGFNWKKDTTENLFDKNNIILTNSPSSQSAFKPLEVSTPNLSNLIESNDETYEPYPEAELTVNSIDNSLCLSQDPSLISDNEDADSSISSSDLKSSSKMFLARFKKSPNVKNNKQKYGLKNRSAQRIGLSKPKGKSSVKSSSEIQLSLKQSLERYHYKKSNSRI